MIRKCLAVSLLALSSTGLMAAECSVDVQSTDQMRFSTDNIVVDKSCKEFTVNLEHTGTMPASIMGHNLVISTAADQQGVINEGMSAGVANNYVKVDDARVIAHTKILGAGEKDSVKFDTSKLKAGENYTFYCTFPGHVALMKGTLTLK
ncbi:azurin [Pseudomonas sp. 5P_3.1_Bac2]|uniref:azurin n=1 Tax=Pseudomonas sp. 5P_3.1_Bac2 TaxID=2971617 RepID=UPI0021C74B71|nr:azurin [Pseudomonas sp. 5P_3.1_Bac2]MCU1717944.1 azurin [Pseudomonas sp. 5P_3.1_Bac2]